MHAYDVIGYTYDAAVHCTDCATTRFGINSDGFVPYAAEDSEGNPVGAVFADTEWYDYYSTEHQVLYCDTCGVEIDVYESPFVTEEDEEPLSCLDCTLSWANLCPRDRVGLDRNSAECDSYTEIPCQGQMIINYLSNNDQTTLED